MIKSLVIWLTIIPCAVLNGAVREKLLTPLLGKAWALPLSGLSLCALIFCITWLLPPRLKRGTKRSYLIIGTLWIFAAVLFETALGLLRGLTVHELLTAYDVTTGNLWLLVVVFIGVVPYWVAVERKLTMD